MKCAWKELIHILPHTYRLAAERLAGECLQEIRLRLHQSPEMILKNKKITWDRLVTEEDLQFVINTASRYSPWLATSSASGYITAPGGHRIGICGEAVMKEGNVSGFRYLRSLNIRISRDFPGLCGTLGERDGSFLIIGKPGSGKTTLLRDMIRQRSLRENVSVVDERGEIFPICGGFYEGKATDIITGCPKPQGIEAVLRTMSPDTIAVDEITAEYDCQALLHAGWCGVKLLATAHASDKQDLLSRPIYAPLVRSGLFSWLVILQPDKSWHLERMEL